MRAVCGLLLFLLAGRTGRSQFFYTAPRTAPGIDQQRTPAQSDWVMKLEQQEAAFSHGPADRPRGESVSVARLRHQPPRKATGAFSRGMKYAQAEAWQQASAEFQRATAADPQFSEAHGNLGVAYTNIGLFDEAASSFRRAIALDPVTGVHHANLAFALYSLNQASAAEREAQTAVDLDASDSKAQFLLGFLLAQHAEERAHAEEHLRYAARAVPDAHYVLAELYQADGASQAAAAELDKFRKAQSSPHVAGGSRDLR